MALIYKIFDSRTGIEKTDTNILDNSDFGAFVEWLNENNTCYEWNDVNRPENDACNYELRVFEDSDNSRRYFNTDTQLFDLSEVPVSV